MNVSAADRKVSELMYQFGALALDRKVKPGQAKTQKLLSFLPWLKSSYDTHRELKQQDTNLTLYPVIACLPYTYSNTPSQRVPYFTLDTMDMKIRSQGETIQLPLDSNGLGKSEQDTYFDIIRKLNVPITAELTPVLIQGSLEDRESKIENLKV